jgi:hypothetical protein
MWRYGFIRLLTTTKSLADWCTLVRRYTRRTGRLLQQGTTVFASLVVWAAVRHRAWPSLLILMPIPYQYISCSLAIRQPQYLSNLILLQLLVIVHGIGLVASWIPTSR